MDGKHQIVIEPQAHGKAQEHLLLLPMVEGLKRTFGALGDEVPLNGSQLTADAGFHTENNIKQLFQDDADAYVADTRFRKRDSRCAHADRYKPENSKDPARLFTPDDFVHNAPTHTCVCPAGKRLYLKNRHARLGQFYAISYQGAKRDCESCHRRSRCLTDPNQKTTRQVCFFKGRAADSAETCTHKMQRKIDSEAGRRIYSQRLGTVEPVFAHIQGMGLTRFSHRGQRKVDHQWRFFCWVHNVKQIYRYAE